MQSAIKKLIKRKSCKKQYIQVEKTLTVSKVTNLVTIIVSSSCNNREKLLKRMRVERHCGRCGETKYNSRTYIVEIENVENSEESK